MLDEELDHIVRNAVDKHHPAYNDKAWGKMELKLDKHLPLNKDRRKFIFFLLFFLLLGGGAFFTIFQLSGIKKSTGNTVTENVGDKQMTTEPVLVKAVPGNDNIKNSPDKTATDQVTAVPVNKMFNTVPQDNNISTTETLGGNKRSALVRKGRSNMRITAANLAEDLVQDKNPETKNGMPPAGKTVNTVEKMNIVITAAEPDNNESENITTVPADLNKDKDAIAEQKKDTAKATEDKKEVVVPENKISLSPDKKKSKKNVAGNFGITFSAGPDLSFIKLDKLGKATLMYGAGLSYNFKKRITVRAGFYVSEKIYTATPEQYQFTPGMNYYYLKKIDATCKIYEIPLSLSYNFWQRKNHNWFGSAGLSSFLMKTESYDYGYKTPAGYTYNYKHKISNENKHYFAVLTLSGGYQYQFNKRVSLQAEPYVKLPLAGVGQGKIKLNSAGILFTVTVKPFAKGK